MQSLFYLLIFWLAYSTRGYCQFPKEAKKNSSIHLGSDLEKRFFSDMSLNPLYQVKFVLQFSENICGLFNEVFSTLTGQCELKLNPDEQEILMFSQRSLYSQAFPSSYDAALSVEEILSNMYNRLKETSLIVDEDPFHILIKFFTGDFDNEAFSITFFNQIAPLICRLFGMNYSENTRRCHPNEAELDYSISPIASGVLFDLTQTPDTDSVTNETPFPHNAIQLVYDSNNGVAFFSGVESHAFRIK